METLLTIAIIVFGILQIILFFKIWGMTDDIREIKNKYVNSRPILFESEPASVNQLFKDGDPVIEIKNNKELIVKKYDASINKYICYSSKGTFEGSYYDIELRRR